MAATTSQGRGLTLFMVGITTATAGLAYFSSGIGKLAFFVGLIVVAGSLGWFLKLKPLEGAIAAGAQPAVLKLAGLAAVVLGWLFVLYGLHLTTSLSGRMGTTIVGFGISLIGALVILPAAANKNAIWKKK